MRLINKKNASIFLISGLISVITLFYLGAAFRKHGSPASVPYHLFIIMIPLLYGLFGLINYYVVQKYGQFFSLLVGAVFGLLLSLIGRFILNLPILIFGFTKKTEYKVHIYATLLYAGIFQLIISPITNKLI
jgi:hypothetical protein